MSSARLGAVRNGIIGTGIQRHGIIGTGGERNGIIGTGFESRITGHRVASGGRPGAQD